MKFALEESLYGSEECWQHDCGELDPMNVRYEYIICNWGSILMNDFH